MANRQTEPRAAHLEQRKRTHTKTPKGQKQKKSTSWPKPCPNPFRTNRFNAPETWPAVPANKTARVTESRATPRCGTEDKSTFVLIQVFLCAPGILEKNGPVWKNREPRQHPRNQMSWSPFAAHSNEHSENAPSGSVFAFGIHGLGFLCFGFSTMRCPLKSGTIRSCSSILRRPRSSIGNPALCCDHA